MTFFASWDSSSLTLSTCQRLTVSILSLFPHMGSDLERLSEYLNDVPGLQAFALDPQTEMFFCWWMKPSFHSSWKRHLNKPDFKRNGSNHLLPWFPLPSSGFFPLSKLKLKICARVKFDARALFFSTEVQETRRIKTPYSGSRVYWPPKEPF